MFVLRSTHDALKARYEQVLAQRPIHTGSTAAQWRHLAGRAIRQTVSLGDRLERMVRATARLRAENAQLRRQVAQLHAAYDHAVGLDSPALDEGRHWQQRRSDRPRAKAVES